MFLHLFDRLRILLHTSNFQLRPMNIDDERAMKIIKEIRKNPNPQPLPPPHRERDRDIQSFMCEFDDEPQPRAVLRTAVSRSIASTSTKANEAGNARKRPVRGR